MRVRRFGVTSESAVFLRIRIVRYGCFCIEENMWKRFGARCGRGCWQGEMRKWIKRLSACNERGQEVRVGMLKIGEFRSDGVAEDIEGGFVGCQRETT